MADLFPYITEEVIEAINKISHSLEEQNFNGAINITSQQFIINEATGQQYAYEIRHNARQQQIQSYARISDIVTELLYQGDVHPVPSTYQLNNNLEWKAQIIRILTDIIESHDYNATQLQKYYQLGRLYQNIPRQYKRKLTALKYDFEKECRTRTIDNHLRITKRTWQIFTKIGLQRLQRNIDITSY